MKQLVWCVAVLGLVLNCICKIQYDPLYACESDVYCYGSLLDTIQRAEIFADSKTFVDMKMRYSPKETLKRFDSFMSKYKNKPSKLNVQVFVNDTFEPTGQEFEKWYPQDWVVTPMFLEKIRDVNFRRWASDLNKLWKKLGRKIKEEVKMNLEKYSIIWVPNPVIVPGGRFREFYYWDSYWIMHGLLLSGMQKTVKGMLENLLSLVDTYGHVPNGGRIYYSKRSQPPLLIPMVKLYLEYSCDINFMKDNLHLLEKEFEFWITKRKTTITLMNGNKYTLATYGYNSKGPRPEFYALDVEVASYFKGDKKDKFYSELKAAAESGWDFSSRWLIRGGTNYDGLTDTKARSIVPVDLNAILYKNAILLSEFSYMVDDPSKVQYYLDLAKEWMKAVTAVLWHADVGSWLDYDMSNSMRRDYFYISNIAPLWAGCYDRRNKSQITELVLTYLHSNKVLHNGGVPTSFEPTGQDWDFPNAWAPLHHMLIVGLNSTGIPAAQRFAFEIAKKWVRSNYRAYQRTGTMYEKYDATIVGRYERGTRNRTQLGFGWTNGVILDLLYKYADKLTVDDRSNAASGSLSQTLAVLMVTAEFVRKVL